MSKSSKVLVLSVLAVTSFPVTIGLVALDIRSIANRALNEMDVKDGPQNTQPDDPRANHPSRVQQNIAETSDSLQPQGGTTDGKITDGSILDILHNRVFELKAQIDDSKAKQKEILAQLEENKKSIVINQKSLKATESAIREITAQIPNSNLLRADSMIRPSMNTTLARGDEKHLIPDGWEAYLGVLGHGITRPYKLQEISEISKFIDLILALPPTSLPRALRNADIMTAGSSMHRVVYLSGLEQNNQFLMELRRLGAERSIEFKRVRSELPSFNEPRMMVQVFPASQSSSAQLEEKRATESTKAD